MYVFSFVLTFLHSSVILLFTFLVDFQCGGGAREGRGGAGEGRGGAGEGSGCAPHKENDYLW